MRPTHGQEPGQEPRLWSGREGGRRKRDWEKDRRWGRGLEKGDERGNKRERLVCVRPALAAPVSSSSLLFHSVITCRDNSLLSVLRKCKMASRTLATRVLDNIHIMLTTSKLKIFKTE